VVPTMKAVSTKRFVRVIGLVIAGLLISGVA
jgi:hypothetical protein